MSELDEVRRRYARRLEAPSEDLYSLSRPENFWAQHELDAAFYLLLREARLTQFEDLRVLEVGCGTGAHLLRFLRWGVPPGNLSGIDLLPVRIAAARQRLPVGVSLAEGDASQDTFEEDFDVVMQCTVFSSILDDDFQAHLASSMWRRVRPGGAVLSYDFVYNNPRNADVRRVPVRRLRMLFPDAEISAKRVTVAPPIARRVGPDALHRALVRVPPLKSHRAVCLRKTR